MVPTTDNIVQLVRAGRARWKIEDEAFNTLKNQGYHLKHNFGHGDRHLSEALFVLNRSNAPTSVLALRRLPRPFAVGRCGSKPRPPAGEHITDLHDSREPGTSRPNRSR